MVAAISPLTGSYGEAHAGGTWAEWVRYYNEGRFHSALKYLRPIDYYKGNPVALLAERKRKLKEAAPRRKEVNKWADLISIKGGYIILAPSICPKTTESLRNEALMNWLIVFKI